MNILKTENKDECYLIFKLKTGEIKDIIKIKLLKETNIKKDIENLLLIKDPEKVLTDLVTNNVISILDSDNTKFTIINV
jgi:hypothetical protein